MVRMSAEERRESVIRAATAEFARGGYFGTSTEAIAKRVGVSQPYLFRLFPSKKALFLEVVQRCMDDLVRVFEEAGEGLEGEEAVHAIGDAYTRVISERPEQLLMQMQMYVAVASAEQAGDRELGEAVRAGWMRLWDTVHGPLGAEVGGTTTFMAYGMLINCLVAMGFPADHRVWEGLSPQALAEGSERTP
ncbi:helix-turn-helix domain-containing protein [Streptomyces sp. NPDC005840]|jgi:AcrR family transcriptional regulator|uniref:Helix-turn-helix domain-containing protein n=1 Tax=Streptomyces doudnae TaxID=3075536 RepID=A0ABD5EIJ1_9ACTN|nr:MULTISPECIES: TetR/AcrR family transcriptional regulator [unclassified Streptomyces]MDT0434103.1 helix-turn-helix domain-containing protein [Streptomyces sp. DSM 41981]SCD44970.1 transcriptional regulator, TetR family [Streptomyces sp. SolWspMP-5a-2]